MTQANEIRVYKIRNRDNGLYSTGGSHPSWTKRGKTWGNIGGLKNHLNIWCSSYNGIKDIPDEWEIVEIVVKEEDTNKWPARIVSDDLKRREAIKEKFGWHISNALDSLKNIDLNRYRYVFEIDYSWRNREGFNEILKELKNLGLKRENYRYRTPVILFDNLDHAFTVKLVFGEKVSQFIDLVELKDLMSTLT